jgi:hypothetical protein
LPKPFSIRIGGFTFSATLVKPSFWIDSHGSAHIGKLHKKRPPPVKVIRKSKTCSKCKKPAWTTTDRGRALHVSCEGFADTLPDDVREQMIYEYAAYAKAVIL